MSQIDKYRSLLREIDDEEEKEKNKAFELECTWDLDTGKKMEQSAREKLMKSKDVNPFEKYIEKTKEKKALKREKRLEKARQKEEENASDSDDSVPSDVDMNDPYFAEERAKKTKKSQGKKRKAEEDVDLEEEKRTAEMELLMMDETEEKAHFNMKKIEQEQSMSKSKKKRMDKKWKKEKVVEDTFIPDVHDKRFEKLYTSHNYNMDPANQHYRKTKGTEAFVAEKLRRRAEEEKNQVC